MCACAQPSGLRITCVGLDLLPHARKRREALGPDAIDLRVAMRRNRFVESVTSQMDHDPLCDCAHGVRHAPSYTRVESSSLLLTMEAVISHIPDKNEHASMA